MKVSKEDEEKRKYYDPDKVTITKGEPRSSYWLEGTINCAAGYTFEAQVFDVGSQYGIDGGRVSKLNLYLHGQQVAQYDRGIWEGFARSYAADEKAIEEVKAAFAKPVAREQVQDEQPAPEPPYQVDPSRPVNPMGFFKDKPAPESRKDWSRTREPARHTAAPIADHTDDDDHSR